jgi:hypothetical protein
MGVVAAIVDQAASAPRSFLAQAHPPLEELDANPAADGEEEVTALRSGQSARGGCGGGRKVHEAGLHAPLLSFPYAACADQAAFAPPGLLRVLLVAGRSFCRASSVWLAAGQP